MKPLHRFEKQNSAARPTNTKLIYNCEPLAPNDNTPMKDLLGIYGTLQALKFLFIGPLILALLFVINLMTSPHHWWIQWPALGIGIAWVINLIRVLKAVVIVGGLTALVKHFRR